MVWPQGVKHGLDSGPFGALARRDFCDLEFELIEAEQGSKLFILGDAAGKWRGHKNFIGVVVLKLRDGVAHGARVSVRLGGICTHAHDAIDALKANDLARLLEIGGEAL